MAGNAAQEERLAEVQVAPAQELDVVVDVVRDRLAADVPDDANLNV